MELLTNLMKNPDPQSLFIMLGCVAIIWAMKVIPNQKIKLVVGKFMYGAGVTITLGLAKWPFTKRYWNSLVEPFLIDLIENVLVEGCYKFISGMRSDAPEIESKTD